MDHDTLIGIIVRRTGIRREVHVRVADAPGWSRNVAVFAGEVARLAALGAGGVAEGDFAAVGGVEVGEGGGAVAVGGDGLCVDVVD